jgi:protein-L-isoaspartate(D-aspartate) O-methyltransferase
MNFAVERARLVEHLQTRIADERVLAAMKRVPRECFVPDEFESGAYRNEPLPIGHNQTISQPLMVAIMAQALELKGNEKVLEVGTGSGYQAAILAELAARVITTERISHLAQSARRILDALGYTNIEVHLAGSRMGWEAEAPYDAIIVTAGAPRIPGRLLEQMLVGGRMVIPVGSRDIQQLYQVTRLKDRNVIKDLGGCRFVPLIGEEAWEEV